MSTGTDNPCLECEIDQDCCTRLKGLMLTPAEFECNFRDYAQRLSAVRKNDYYLVSTQNESACPHWKDGGCRIYDERPIDCRLFPYMISRISSKRKKIRIEFRRQTHCPRSDRLTMTDAEAQALVLAFAREVYGEEKQVLVRGEGKFASWLRERVVPAIRRILGKRT
jgi:Fe-S-cluster containining protein